jgi:hypothetical protein
MIVDEIMSQLDGQGRARVAELMRSLVRSEGAEEQAGRSFVDLDSLFVVMQDNAAEEFEEPFDSMDWVVRKGDSSFLER